MKNLLFLLSVLLVSVSFGQTAEEYFNLGKSKIPFDYEGAIPYLTKAIELDPNYALAYYERGKASFKIGNFRFGIEDFSKAIEIDPAFARAYHARGITKAHIDEYSGAIADYTKAIELNPAFALAYSHRGDAKYALSDIDGACLDWSKAVELGEEVYHDGYIKENCK